MDNIHEEKNIISIKLRLGSMLLDHFIMCAIIIPPLIFLSLILNNSFETSPIETFAFYFMVFIYLNKDFIKGKSAAKRILGLKVVDIKSEEPANEFKCFLRNITIPIWPLEVLISLVSPTRRLGDLIANTRVEISEKESVLLIFKEFEKIKFTQVTLMTLVIGISYMVIIWYLMDQLMKT